MEEATYKKLRITLAAARVNKGLTQSQVAAIMHVSKSTIINWEKCKIIPKPAQFEMMCRIYGVDRDDINLFPN